MTMYFLEDWKKKPQDSYEYVNRHASGEMFRNLQDSLDRLCGIMDRELKEVFTTTNSAVWFAVFDRFRTLGMPEGRFREFVLYFKTSLEELKVGGRPFAEVYRSKNTRDRAVVQNKIRGLVTLMVAFFQVSLPSGRGAGVEPGKESPGQSARDKLGEHGRRSPSALLRGSGGGGKRGFGVV